MNLNKIFILLFGLTCSLGASAEDGLNLMIAPGTLGENGVCLLWDKQPGSALQYQVAVNGKKTGTIGKTNYTLTGLIPGRSYTVKLNVIQKGKMLKEHAVISFRTASKGKVYNILDFGAKNDALTLNTRAIQAAINACSPGGTVVIPKGTFVSGALFLKSNMTLYLEKGAVLKGSGSVEDYLPMIRNRFEGWEMDTYASLLNAGTLNREGGYNVTNLRITGAGTISGGGKKLGEAMIKSGGIRSRGRLICLMNCENVSISGLTITEPPSWTLHYIYSHNISVHGLNIITYGIRNGDGIDPDSSTDSYIFDCTFDTGDDCIAIKSGKNPEGYFIAKPTKNVRITDCRFKRGHGISIGSEMSGGVSDVLVQDCKAGALLHGMQIKATKDRGGYVRNVTVEDCELMKITVFSELNYNNDGEAAPVPPVFENFVFCNIDLSKASVKEPVININGFNDPAHQLRNVLFKNILLPAHAAISIKNASHIQFENIKAPDGADPEYIISNSSNISR